MKIALRSDGPPREWQRRLAERLARDGHTLLVERRPACRRVPRGLRLLLAGERRLYGVTPRLFAPADLPTHDGTDGELVLEPRFDGAAGEGALVEALLARHSPHVEIYAVSGAAERRLAAGLPAIERRDVLASALDMVLARTAQLVEQAVHATAGTESPCMAAAPVERGSVASPPVFLARAFAAKLVRWLGRASGGRAGWRIAVGRCEDADRDVAHALASGRFALLDTDGTGFQADPFLFGSGSICLFYEEFPDATRKGVIAMVELDAAGRASPPRRVLEHDVHLSYPFVFAYEDAIYMLPEMSCARRVQLFRADPFPDRWVPDRVLVDDAVLSDATLVAHDGRWWLFANQSGDGGSSWDALCLFHAPDPRGPWTPHAGNPVLIDAGAARPAGAMWHASGHLMRVAQDCRNGYGCGLAICRVDRLDPHGFEQTVVRRLGPPDGLGADRIHTFNRADGFVAIDVHNPPRRQALRRRGSADPAAPRAPARG